MKKLQLDHVLRAAGRITGERQFIIIGSQALHGSCPDLADEILKSVEVDLIAGAAANRTEWLNAIGYLSPFHQEFGYYADPVDVTSAVLAEGWRSRLVRLSPGDTEGVSGLCLEPHDLAIAKLAAARDKDRIFTRELAQRRIISRPRVLQLLSKTKVETAVRERMLQHVGEDFAGGRVRGGERGGSGSRGAKSAEAAAPPGTAEDGAKTP